MKAEGLRYEDKVVKLLESKIKAPVVHGQWIEYNDLLGHGFAQVDALVFLPERVLVVECKRTFQPAALKKLADFYLPLCEAAWPGRPAFGVQVCKNLIPEARSFAPWAPPWEAPPARIFSYHFPALR